MTLIDLLDRLAECDVHLWAEDDRLRVRARAGALTAELRDALAAHKPELLARLRARSDDGLPPIERIPRAGPLPLSFAQRRLWFLAELEPTSAAYTIPAAIRITGPLDPVVLERAVNEIVRRHEVLRTTFRNDRGEPALEIQDERAIALDVVDCRGVAEAEQETDIRRLAAGQTRARFDLARGPLLRVSLVRLADHEHVLLFTIHHLASDGWSSRVLLREVAALYDAFARRRPSPLPELPLQYVDFAAWQRRWLQGERLERQLAYWRARLERLPTLALPTDRPRPRVQTFDGASMRFAIGGDVRERLKTLAREEGATLFQLLLAAFAALLHLVTGAADLPIGSPVANRSRRELEQLVGFFVNTLILRIDVSGRTSARALVRRVREVSLEAYAHQDLPFEQLVAELQPERDLSRHALFQVVFVHQDNPVERQEFPGLALRQLDVESWHVKFDLVVNTWESHDGIVVWWEYNSMLFDGTTIAGLFERYARLLDAILEQPDAPVDDLEILSAEERRLLASDLAVPALDGDFAFPS